MSGYLEIEPARAKRVSDKKLADIWDSHGWIAEEKMNGWRYLMHFGGALDRVYLTGRRISERTGLLSEKGLQVPDLWPNNDDNLFSYTVLDGEIFPPEGASFRDIAGIMNADPEVAKATIARIGPPTYHVFDILLGDGDDYRELTQIERRKILEVKVDLIDHPLIRLVPQRRPERAFFDEVVTRGGEGLILKDLGAEYGEGWVKVKREHTIDVVVTGFTEARFGRTGRIHGQIGALVVSVYADGVLTEVAQVSGMDDATRLEITQNKSEWLGRVVEITAQEWGKDRLLHPRFTRVREDADPRSCTFTKMMRDLGRAESTCPESDPQLTLL